MSFAITVDHFPDSEAKPGTNANAVGVVGPSTTKKTFDEIVIHPNGKKFRMLDDDDVPCYEGVFVGDDEFQPLDCFGTPNAGATSIQYFENGKWQTL